MLKLNLLVKALSYPMKQDKRNNNALLQRPHTLPACPSDACYLDGNTRWIGGMTLKGKNGNRGKAIPFTGLDRP